jgi:ABC-type branched-subunit amino acid transport system ATPase component
MLIVEQSVSNTLSVAGWANVIRQGAIVVQSSRDTLDDDPRVGAAFLGAHEGTGT